MEVSIKQALENPGSNGITVSGEITKVWPRKTGKGEYGEYSFQDLVLQDSSGDTQITVTMANFEPFDDNKGKTVTFESRPNKQGNLVGVKVMPDTGYGVKLKVTEFANIIFEGEEMPPEEQERMKKTMPEDFQAETPDKPIDQTNQILSQERGNGLRSSIGFPFAQGVVGLNKMGILKLMDDISIHLSDFQQALRDKRAEIAEL